MVERHDDEPRDAGEDHRGEAPEHIEVVAQNRRSAPGHGFPVEGEPLPDEAIRIPADQQRELTALEMMDAPARPNERTRKTVLWIALAFAAALFSLTVGVIAASGIDILEVFTLLLLGGVIVGLIGALRYRGEDPMAQFDPPPIPKGRLGRKRRRRVRTAEPVETAADDSEPDDSEAEDSEPDDSEPEDDADH